MLKWRVLTAAVLIPLFVWVTLSQPNTYFALLLAVVVLGGAWEWTRLSGLTWPLWRVTYVILSSFLMAWVYQLDNVAGIMGLAVLWWCIAIMWLWRYAQTPPGAARQEITKANMVLKLLIGPWVLIPAWLALIEMHGDTGLGPAYVLLLFILVWGADTGAYFCGRRWGKYKLAPAISPGKTWEGAAGGLLTVLVVGGLALNVEDFRAEQPGGFIIVCIVAAIFSIVGDLFESMVKRQVGVKDSGHLLPGHGGILDRIDSITAAAPIFLTGLYFIGHHS